MCTAYIIVYVSDGQVDWPVLVMTGADRDSCLVTAKNDGNKHRPGGIWVFSDQVLQQMSDKNTILRG